MIKKYKFIYYYASEWPESLPMKMRREATGKRTTAVKTAQSGCRKPATSNRHNNTSNAYKNRFPPEYTITSIQF